LLPPNDSCRAITGGKTCVLGLLALSILGSMAGPARAQSEDQVKAAFLLNFARYVEWPEDAFDSRATPVRICLIGTRDFKDVVAHTVEGKVVHDRRVSVETVEAAAEADACHLLFVGEEALVGSDGAVLLRELRRSNVFTVGDREGFAASGGIANFYRAGNKVRFEVNPEFAAEANLEVSSKLLRLARIVR
jgi:hypothetical protein